jgi:hypothetical protein
VATQRKSNEDLSFANSHIEQSFSFLIVLVRDLVLALQTGTKSNLIRIPLHPSASAKTIVIESIAPPLSRTSLHRQLFGRFVSSSESNPNPLIKIWEKPAKRPESSKV